MWFMKKCAQKILLEINPTLSWGHIKELHIKARSLIHSEQNHPPNPLRFCAFAFSPHHRSILGSSLRGLFVYSRRRVKCDISVQEKFL